MMFGTTMGWGWMWFSSIVLLVILAALIVLVVRTYGAAPTRSGRAGEGQEGSARRIAEERLARGEIGPDEFDKIVRALDNRM